MALEDYPFGVEELTPAGEMVRIIAYLDPPIIAAQRSGPALRLDANCSGTHNLRNPPGAESKVAQLRMHLCHVNPTRSALGGARKSQSQSDTAVRATSGSDSIPCKATVAPRSFEHTLL